MVPLHPESNDMERQLTEFIGIQCVTLKMNWCEKDDHNCCYFATILTLYRSFLIDWEFLSADLSGASLGALPYPGNSTLKDLE